MKKLLLISGLLLFSAISAAAEQRFVASLSGAQEVPANASAGKGTCTIVLNTAQTQITLNCTFSGLGSAASAAHIHGNAAVGVNAPILITTATGAPTRLPSARATTFSTCGAAWRTTILSTPFCSAPARATFS